MLEGETSFVGEDVMFVQPWSSVPSMRLLQPDSKPASSMTRISTLLAPGKLETHR